MSGLSKLFVDALGKPLNMGDYVLVASRRFGFSIGTIFKETPDYIKVLHSTHTYEDMKWDTVKKLYVKTGKIKTSYNTTQIPKSDVSSGLIKITKEYYDELSQTSN